MPGTFDPTPVAAAIAVTDAHLNQGARVAHARAARSENVMPIQHAEDAALAHRMPYGCYLTYHVPCTAQVTN